MTTPVIPEAEPQARLSRTSPNELEHASRGPGSERRSRTARIAPSGMTGTEGSRLARNVRRPALLQAASILAVVVAWEVGGRIPISPTFPTFLETGRATLAMIADGSLIMALGITLVPLAIGIVLSALLGIAAGVAMGLERRVEWFGLPLFIVLQAAPLAALIPLVILAYGIGVTTKVVVVCIMAIPVIVLNSFKAVRHAPASLIEMGCSFLGSRRQLIFKIILPAAAPVIFAGLRLGVASGFVGAVLAELLITPTGVGDIITYNQSVAEYPAMYGAIASVIAVSVIFIKALEWVELRFFRPERRGA
jgi:ABC-type nitrate/sulfonate/bicarbonate transport system permease component